MKMVCLEDLEICGDHLMIDPVHLRDRLDQVVTQPADGLPVIVGDSREVYFRGQLFKFPKGDRQRQIIIFLRQQAEAGRTAVTTAEIVAGLDLGASTRIRDIFKGHPAWGVLLQEKGGVCSFCWDLGSASN